MKLAEASKSSLILYVEPTEFDDQELGPPELRIVLSIRKIKFNVLSNHPDCEPSYEPGFEMHFLTSDGIVVRRFSKTSRMNCSSKVTFL